MLALYGHADAGGFWEAHCEEKLVSVGWTRLAEEWPGTFWHQKTGSMMIVYVDDFKLAAKHAEHDALWAAIREVIDMDPETLDGRFLGCSHERFTTSVSSVSWLLDQHPEYHPRQKQGGALSASAETRLPVATSVARIYDPKKTVSVVSYNMERFAVDCVSVFCELSGWDKNKIGTAPTPFLEEANDPVAIFEEDAVQKKGKGKSTGSPVASAPPCTGALSKIACKVLMKIMYLARFARTDLLRAVGVLSTMITKWDTLCDRKLFRIIKYINGTSSWRQIGFVGDSPSELSLGLFSDADFAGCKASQRSTSGVFLALYGPHTFFPLSAQSKKQTATSHSTVEAEIIAADHAIRTAGLPALALWETILDRSISLDVFQDNQATARIMSSGRAPTLRHVRRTHQVSVAWLHERITSPDVILHDCISEVMAADIFTKHFTSKDKWGQVCNLIGIVSGKHMSYFQQCSRLPSTACPAILAPCGMSASAPPSIPWQARRQFKGYNQDYGPQPRPSGLSASAEAFARARGLSASAEAHGGVPGLLASAGTYGTPPGSSGGLQDLPIPPPPPPLLRPKGPKYARTRYDQTWDDAAPSRGPEHAPIWAVPRHAMIPLFSYPDNTSSPGYEREVVRGKVDEVSGLAMWYIVDTHMYVVGPNPEDHDWFHDLRRHCKQQDTIQLPPASSATWRPALSESSEAWRPVLSESSEARPAGDEGDEEVQDPQGVPPESSAAGSLSAAEGEAAPETPHVGSPPTRWRQDPFGAFSSQFAPDYWLRRTDPTGKGKGPASASAGRERQASVRPTGAGCQCLPQPLLAWPHSLLRCGPRLELPSSRFASRSLAWQPPPSPSRPPLATTMGNCRRQLELSRGGVLLGSLSSS